MSKKYQNIFFIFGAVVLAFMITRLDFEETWNGIRHAGYWFVAVLLLWAVLYVFNSLTWYIIIRSGDKKTHIPFWWLYKITISGFALNYAISRYGVITSHRNRTSLVNRNLIRHDTYLQPLYILADVCRFIYRNRTTDKHHELTACSHNSLLPDWHLVFHDRLSQGIGKPLGSSFGTYTGIA